uniref:Uncharacterized protein n=1 Tax=Ceratitis capitata TaxID=7213 RepID=W8B0I0_CERCA
MPPALVAPVSIAPTSNIIHFPNHSPNPPPPNSKHFDPANRKNENDCTKLTEVKIPALLSPLRISLPTSAAASAISNNLYAQTHAPTNCQQLLSASPQINHISNPNPSQNQNLNHSPNPNPSSYLSCSQSQNQSNQNKHYPHNRGLHRNQHLDQSQNHFSQQHVRKKNSNLNSNYDNNKNNTLMVSNNISYTHHTQPIRHKCKQHNHSDSSYNNNNNSIKIKSARNYCISNAERRKDGRSKIDKNVPDHIRGDHLYIYGTLSISFVAAADTTAGIYSKATTVHYNTNLSSRRAIGRIDTTRLHAEACGESALARH